MSTKGVYLSWIVVNDIEAAIKFYTEVAGLQLREFHKDFGWAELSGPEGMTLGLAQESQEQQTKAGTNAVVTITVEDIVATREMFLKKGVRLLGNILEVAGHVKLQTFMDNDGNMLQLAQML